MSVAAEAKPKEAPPSSLTLLPQAGEGNTQPPSPRRGEGWGVRWARRRAIERDRHAGIHTAAMSMEVEE